MKTKTRAVAAATAISAARSGFTLIEIMLVVVIIGILAAIILPNLGGKTKQASISATKASIANISLAIDSYEVDNGAYPPSLQALITKGSELHWNGPYLKKTAIPKDDWGKEFIYTLKDNGYELRSSGPNGTAGDNDDITN
jgi:general secretion pathway protein G